MVTERRNAGSYPEGLEAALDRSKADSSPANAGCDLTAVHRSWQFLHDRSLLEPIRISTASRFPGGEILHRAAGRAVSRQTQGITQQVQELAQQTTLVFESVLTSLEAHVTDVHQELADQLDKIVERLDAILQRLAQFDRQSLGPEEDLLHLRRRVEELESAEARRGLYPWFDSRGFEERFRGSREDLLDRYRDLAEHLRDCGPVLDIGFGRGEMLELLAALGVPARGVEIDPALVEAAQARGLDVARGDAIGTLAPLEDGTLGGIVLIQVVEHLASQELLEFIALAVDKVRPGGRLVIETVNPQCLSVFANSFYLDPSHVRPVHPAYLDFLCRQVGFADVWLDWRSFPPPGDRLAEIANVPDLNRNIDKLNHLLFGPGDYAVIATR
jgi:O-antigen chain-terminating methyltransferase